MNKLILRPIISAEDKNVFISEIQMKLGEPLNYEEFLILLDALFSVRFYN